MDAAERFVDEMNEEWAEEEDAWDEYKHWQQVITAERGPTPEKEGEDGKG